MVNSNQFVLVYSGVMYSFGLIIRKVMFSKEFLKVILWYSFHILRQGINIIFSKLFDGLEICMDIFREFFHVTNFEV